MRVAKASQWKPSREEAQACGPAEGTPDHPAFGQQDKAAPGLREFDPLGMDAVRGGGGILPGAALIHAGHPDIFAGDFPDPRGEHAGLCAILLMGGRGFERKLDGRGWQVSTNTLPPCALSV